MLIEVTETEDGLHGQSEVWVRVLSNQVVDWPTIQKDLRPEQKDALRDCELKPSAYYPGQGEDGYPYCDVWVFTYRRNAR